jgi:hypothetical protein
MTLARRSLRILAAVFAVLGLFARPLQALVDCPMPMKVAEASSHHAGHGQPAESPDTSEKRCPDVAHCAVAAPIADAALAAVDARVRVTVVAFVNERPASTTSSLEPPPPKLR